MDMSIRIPLAAEQVSFYRSSGYVAPVRVLPEDEAAGYRRHLEAFEAAHGGPIPGKYRHKPHLLFPWLADLVRHPRILDAVESLLGPDLLVWSSVFFIKEPHDPAYVSWHQDSTYWELSEPEVVTAWVALSPSHHENGCLRVVPGTQMLDQVEHVDMQDENNLLTRGQEIAVKVDEAAAVELPLQPGEMSLHHIRLFHNSQPNQSDERRIASPSAISPLGCARTPSTAAPPRWCAESIATVTSILSRVRSRSSHPRRCSFTRR